MVQPQYHYQPKGDYFGGGFHLATDPNGEWSAKSPADAKDVLGVYPYSYSHVDEAVQSARKGFQTWRKTTLQERARLLKAYQAQLQKRQDELTEVIAREAGKPLWEAKTEVTTMINKIDVTLQESLKFVEPVEMPDLVPGGSGAYRYKPLGVMAVVGPFNFPGHLPNGHFVPALATGNTVIFKPSEKTPTVGQIVAECFDQAGFPAGAFNLVQGDPELSRRLCIHEGVDGVLFTGSYEVGTRIKQDTLHQHWKLLALEMGGKNASIIWEDAHLESALKETLFSAFVTTGQRCSATSRVLVHHKIMDAFLEKFHAAAKRFQIGHPLENPFMGPLINAASVERYMKFLGIAAREGCEIIMRGKELDLPFEGHYVTPSLCQVKNPTIDQVRKSVYQQAEIFAPNVTFLPVQHVEEAIELANLTQYGLVASVFTQSEKIYRLFWDGLQVGLINWNKSTVGASSRLPFGGIKKSGNHFPTALTATLYCTYPVSSLEFPTQAKDDLAKTPGLNWES